ncbi:dTDP-4-dehydrorhamnose 3,5-epimerase [Mucilaginibacter limnophilus]|uniref:dTDP-4-dehydrorhamnose 3,5-epimerase n=1 Tax=Mucilaginibacter limnophilus TaxID=1932778 RepID=A0A3S2VLA1_9SPHI|nr:dTDP-4-dehydrorhamnose 3,5-epimerase [Mucilaginibacter limnophilus]RVT99870.1 dTDP-4-dehydrorhamnose 3,5-epimerase [Mucilaginibacter limnophilus]
MTIEQTPLEGCYLIKPAVFNDDRGYFFESYNQEKFDNLLGNNIRFVQDNQSYSVKGTLRGLHFQKGEHAQAKLVRVVKGEVLDVAVDMRPGSVTFGQHFSALLTESNQLQMFVPRGFAHGFVVLSDEAIFFYKCDNFYNKASEGGLHYADPTLNIDWKLPHDELVVSEKDKVLPYFEGTEAFF